jgi:hypothetical protein
MVLSPKELQQVKQVMKEVLEEKEKIQRPLQYAIYKGKGAFQFQLGKAYSGKREKGAVFIDAAPSKGKRSYDWDNKITFALDAGDIGQALTGFKKGKFKLIHDPHAQTEKQGAIMKVLTLAPGNEGTYYLKLTEKKGDELKEANVSLQPHEARVTCELH